MEIILIVTNKDHVVTNLNWHQLISVLIIWRKGLNPYPANTESD